VFFLVIVAVSVGGLALWIVALIECARMPDPVYRAAGSDKTTWVLIVALAGWIGALIYWFSIRARLRQIEASGAVPAAAYSPGGTWGTPYGAASPATPPGWYRDPQADGQLRWWDGRRWTDHVS
jgi:hypothetical protein